MTSEHQFCSALDKFTDRAIEITDRAISEANSSLRTGAVAPDSSSPDFSDRRCSVCGAPRLTNGACSAIDCPRPLHDYDTEAINALG